MLPMRGYPFGPGGYGGRLLFFCHFQTKAKDAVAQSKAASGASFKLIMSRGKPGEVRQAMSYQSRPSDPDLIPSR